MIDRPRAVDFRPAQYDSSQWLWHRSGSGVFMLSDALHGLATTHGARAIRARLRVVGVACVLVIGGATSVVADSVFDELRPAVFGTRAILDGRDVVSLKAPYRPEDIRAVPLDVEAAFKDGRTVKSVTLIVDNNPSPVAASFKFGPGREKVSLGIKFRLNQQSDVRAVVEASDGSLYMIQQLVKFPGGQAACSAPPSTPPEESLANMGRMKLVEVAGSVAASSVNQRMRLDLSHPNHTGMVLDQITLLYTPLKMVKEMVIRQGDETVFQMDGSIALNENPTIEFDYRRNGATAMTISAKDTDDTAFERTFPLGPSS
jgi:sulfur-oxidizing protein SoxY